MDFLEQHSKRLGRNYGEPVSSDAANRWAPVFGKKTKKAEDVNQDDPTRTDQERTSPENVKNPSETEDPLRDNDYGWDKDPAGTEREFGRDRRVRKRYPVRGSTVKLTADVWIKRSDLYALRSGTEEDGFVKIPKGSVGVVANILPGLDKTSKAIQVKFGPRLEAVFAVGRGHADPCKFLKKARKGMDMGKMHKRMLKRRGEDENGNLTQAQNADSDSDYMQTVEDLRQKFDTEIVDNIVGWADSLVSYQLFMEGEDEAGEYRNMLHSAVDDIANRLFQSGHYDDADTARAEAVGILRNFHVEARRIRRAQAEQPGLDFTGEVDEGDLHEFLGGYIEAALWASNDESDDQGGEPLDKNYTPEDIDPATLQEMEGHSREFLSRAGNMLDQYQDQYNQNLSYAGHDFWLTRNGHGAGFWDRDLGDLGTALTDLSNQFSEYDLYVGDDGNIHGSGRGYRGAQLVDPDLLHERMWTPEAEQDPRIKERTDLALQRAYKKYAAKEYAAGRRIEPFEEWSQMFAPVAQRQQRHVTLPGGLEDEVKRNEFDTSELEMGIRVEMEHTSDPRRAEELAREHLYEIPDYYTRLQLMKDQHAKEMRTGQMGQYFQQQPIMLSVHPSQLGQFNSSQVQGLVSQVEEPGKYKITIPGDQTASGMSTEVLAVDETYNKPDLPDYGMIKAPSETEIQQQNTGLVSPIQPTTSRWL